MALYQTEQIIGQTLDQYKVQLETAGTQVSVACRAYPVGQAHLVTQASVVGLVLLVSAEHLVSLVIQVYLVTQV